MNNTIEERIQLFREKFIGIDEEGGYHLRANRLDEFKDLEQFIRESMEQVQKETLEEVEKKLQPAFDDFSAGGQKMIRAGFVKTGNEIIENVGYMKSIFIKELKPNE